MASNKLSIENLNNIKESLEQKMNESSDSTYNSESSSGTESRSGTESSSGTKTRSRSRSRSKHKNTNYKVKYNNLESKIRYMQLEMVNKEIQITELMDKINSNSNYNAIFTKINYLFERLDNVFTVLTERINTIDDKHYVKLQTLTILDTSEKSCVKAMEKYAIYLVNDVHPLLNNQIYLKNSIDSLYNIKVKDLTSLISKIKKQSFWVKVINVLWLMLFIHIFILCINIVMILGYYMYKYLK